MPNRVETRDTGIFKSIETSPGDSMLEFVQTMISSFRAIPSFEEELSILEAKATSILAAHGSPTPPHGLPGDAAPIAQDASSLVWDIGRLRAELLEGDAWECAARAFLVGRMATRIDVRPYEPHALRGRKQVAAASKGGTVRAAKFGPADVERWRAEFVAIRESNPKISKTEVLELIADRQKVKVSGRTIGRRLEALEQEKSNIP